MAKVTFDTDLCKGCGLCVAACPKKILIIAKDKIHFAASGKRKKLLSGPIVFPIPGPTFATEDNAPEKDVVKSRPVNDKHNVVTIVVAQKMLIKDMTPIQTSSVMGLLLYLGMITAWGDIIKVKCLFIAEAKIENLKNLIPPEVEPVQLPTAVRKTKKTTKKGPQSV